MSEGVQKIIIHARANGASEQTTWTVRFSDETSLFGRIKILGGDVFSIDDGNGPAFFTGDKVMYMRIHDLNPSAE